jgi:hypothetical protein
MLIILGVAFIVAAAVAVLSSKNCKIQTLTRLIFASHIIFSSETKGFGHTARLYLLCFIVPIGHVSKCNASSSNVFHNKLSYAIFRSLELLIIGHRR